MGSGQGKHAQTLAARYDLFLRLFEPRIAERGFAAAGRPRYERVVTPETTAWLGVNRASRGTVLEINLVVGLMNSRIEELVAELTGTEPPGAPNTWMSSIGQLFPERRYDPLLMGDRADVAPEVERLLRELDEVGMPTVRRLADPAALAAALGPLNSIPAPMRRTRAPLAALLAGDAAEAEARLDRELAIVARSATENTLAFRRFAEQFRLLVERGL